MHSRASFALMLLATGALVASGQETEPRTVFQVRYVAAGAVYIDGGREAGLAEGFRLTIKRKAAGQAEMEAQPLGEVTVISTASASAVCEIKTKTGDFQVGDLAYLSIEDAEIVRMLATSKDSHKYAQVVSFSEGDPLDEEARKYVPRPPLPEVNRIRGMFAIEFTLTDSHNVPAASSTTEGFVLRADMTRIGGTYWNFTGFYRGRLTTFGAGPNIPTLTDLINRTYTIGMYYNNPESNYLMGVGRLYIPWATSLDTIDGAYGARKLAPHVLAGIFAGTTPDPTAWNYDPNRQLAGAFVNWDYGSYDSLKYSVTAGAAISRIHWRPDRQFVFLETSIIFKRAFSLYYNLEADKFNRNLATSQPGGIGLSRSFLTLRYQPKSWIALEASDNYFQFLPTFDTQLLATGLLQKYLFQGLSGGLTLNLPWRVSLYTDLGRSKNNNDARASLNAMYGVSWANILGTGFRADARYTRFDSSFGKGDYQMIALSRDVSDRLRLQAQVGQQNFTSPLTPATRSRFGSLNLDWFFHLHYWLGAGWTLYRGGSQNYDQIFLTLGYRF